MTYFILFIVYLVLLLYQGFAAVSWRVPEKTKTWVVKASFTVGLALIIYALFCKAWMSMIYPVVAFFWVPGASQTVTLLFTGRAKRISPLSWVLTVLFIAAVVYVAMNGRFVTD